MSEPHPDPREVLIGLLARRVGAGDPQQLLTVEAEIEADLLLGFLPLDDGTDPVVAGLLGTYHLMRWHASTKADDEAARTALFVSVPTLLADPEALPAPLRSWVAAAHRPPPGFGEDEILAAALLAVASMTVRRFVRRRLPGRSADVVDLLRRAIDLLGVDHAMRPMVMSLLGSAVLVADPTGPQPDLPEPLVGEAIDACRAAVNDEDPSALASLASLLRARAEATHDHAGLLEAVRLLRTASNRDGTDEREVGSLAEEHLRAIKETRRPGAQPAELMLADVEVWLADPRLDAAERAQLDESRDVLARSIARWRDAVGRTPAEVVADMVRSWRESDPEVSRHPVVRFLGRLAGLDDPDDDDSAFALLTGSRRDEFEDLAYLAQVAFRMIGLAATTTPLDEWSAPDLGMSADTTDAAEVLALQEQAITQLEEGSPDRDAVELAHAYLSVATLRRGDREELLAVQRRLGPLLLALPARLAERYPTRTDVEDATAIGIGRQSPFGLMGAVTDAVDRSRRRVEDSTEDDLGALVELATASFAHHLLTGEEPAYERARAAARRATALSSPPPPDLLLYWGLAVLLHGRVLTAHDEEGSGLALFKLLDGDHVGALVTAERSRARLLSAAFVTRADLHGLRAVDPGLAREFVDLRRRDYGGSLFDRTAGGQEGEEARRREWHDLLARVRRLPGLARFLLPEAVGLPELTAASDEGPVVLFVLSDLRSAALVLNDGEVEAVELPGLRPGEVALRADGFHSAVRTLGERADPARQHAAGRAVHDTLAWLWDVVTRPVLEALHIGQHGGGEWQRIWWSPTGPLSLLPLHAAGHHEVVGESVLDRVVSSYTPTLRALIGARAGRVAHRGPTALAVALPTTEGQTPLPATADEATSFAANFPGPHALVGATATRAAVCAALPGSDVVHFACHAAGIPAAPWTSHLVLADGPLSVVEISDLDLDGAELAYLSACATARGGSVLTDEAVHIVSAFQLAGFAQAIGTLWPIEDDLAARAAGAFHDLLAGTDLRGGALALHTVMRRLRSDLPGQPWRWAPYVHAGA